MVKQYAVPTDPHIPGFREMEKKDVPQVAALLRRYLARFEVAQTFEKDEEVEHWFLSGKGRLEGGKRFEQVIYPYVVEVSSVFTGIASSAVEKTVTDLEDRIPQHISLPNLSLSSHFHHPS